MKPVKFDSVGQAFAEADRQKAIYRFQHNIMVIATTDDYRTSEYQVETFNFKSRDAAIAAGGRVLEVI